MICARLARASAATLAIGGVALLFASDVVLVALLPAFPAEGVWLGQLLGASWLAVAALTWGSRNALLGGIYGRPVVSANMTLFVISALALLRPAARGTLLAPLPVLALILSAFAAAYGWLLLRGPIRSDAEQARRMATGDPTETSASTTPP